MTGHLRGRPHGQPRPPHQLRDQQRARRDHADRLAQSYADVLGAGPAKSLADCQTENTYTSRSVAVGAATILGWVGGVLLSPYRCGWCSEYHLEGARSE